VPIRKYEVIIGDRSRPDRTSRGDRHDRQSGCASLFGHRFAISLQARDMHLDGTLLAFFDGVAASEAARQGRGVANRRRSRS
jgi:hypothetical protein